MRDSEAADSGGPRTWPESRGGGSAEFALPARWKLGRPLGSGGQAEVWLVQDLEVGGWVAIKIFRADLSDVDRERLRREVRLGRSLQHPNLVRLYELIESEGRLALVMEWMSGGSLARLLKDEALTIEKVNGVAEQALAGLEYLHAQGVVHRDVKPSNLLLDDEGNVKLADLGLARPLEAGRDLTVTDTTVGTPGFMSPEQIRGGDVTPASDLYSLGATLYKLLTMNPVFEGASHYEVAKHHLESRPRDPKDLRPDCPRWLARFVLRLLEKRPEDRWRDGGAARLALQRRVDLTPPRVVRNLAAVGGGVLVFVLGLAYAGRMAFEAFGHPAAARVEASGREVCGLNDRGEPLWRVTFDGPVRQMEQFDLNRDNHPETVVAAWPDAFVRAGRRARSEVAILDRRGGFVSRIVPEELLATHWSFEYPASFAPILSVVGIGRSGAPAAVVNCRHRNFYPTVLLVYWPRTHEWEPLLYHTGWIGDLAVVPGSDPPRLRFAGVNNRLCMYPIVGELVIGVPTPAAVRPQRAISVSETASFSNEGTLLLAWYTPLDAQGQLLGSLELASDGGSIVRFPSAGVAVDRFGNPTSGPNAGRDLGSQRRAFLADLRLLDPSGQPVTPAGVNALLGALRTRHADLLRERPYATVVETLGARALARAGGLQEAIRVLRRLRQNSDAPDVTLRLAHLEAIAGHLEEAKSLAQEVLAGPNGVRRYDAAQLMRRISFQARDIDGVRKAATAIGYFEQGEKGAAGITAALWVGAHLWWDELTDTDTRTLSSAFAPAGNAAACVARWRLGRTQPGDPDAMAASEEANPDAKTECRIARGAALLGLGRAQEAASVLNDACAHIESLAHDDFEKCQALELGRAIYVKALLAAGEREQAIRVAEALRPEMSPRLLPIKLVDEVLGYGRPDGR